MEELDGSDVIINLAGHNVNCRYNAKNRRIIKESRLKSTRILGKAIAEATHSPGVWLQSSTATIYAHRYEAPNDEIAGIIGGNESNVPESWRFSIEVTKAWEKAASELPTPYTRKVLLRSAMVMSPDRGGVFDTLLRLVRFGLGGQSGDGRQYVSWIHDADFVQAIVWLIEHDELAGIVNLASPNPLPNRDFMKALRQTWGIPIGLPASKWMLEIGALFLRTETELILKSRRVIPTRLHQSGFAFQYPLWENAVQNLCARWRQNESNK